MYLSVSESRQTGQEWAAHLASGRVDHTESLAIKRGHKLVVNEQSGRDGLRTGTVLDQRHFDVLSRGTLLLTAFSPVGKESVALPAMVSRGV